MELRPRPRSRARVNPPVVAAGGWPRRPGRAKQTRRDRQRGRGALDDRPEAHTLSTVRTFQAVNAEDSLEKLPLAQGRIEILEGVDGRTLVRVGMKRVFSDGTGALEFSPCEFVEKLVALIPPPRANQVIYSGILAANAAWRAEVIPKCATSTQAQRDARSALKLAKRDAKRSRRAEEANVLADDPPRPDGDVHADHGGGGADRVGEDDGATGRARRRRGPGGVAPRSATGRRAADTRGRRAEPWVVGVEPLEFNAAPVDAWRRPRRTAWIG